MVFKNKAMKKFIIISLLLFTVKGLAQDTFFQEANERAKNEAYNITNEYNRHLSLTGEEQVLFQKKVEEFLIRRYKIEKDFTGKEKLDLLLKMQIEETAEMNDILTRPQLELYKKIKPQIQPLETVTTKKE